MTVKYTGRPGVHIDGDGSTEGWFRNNNPVGDGGFVTTEPLGTMAWMPLNNHPTAKPTYDFYDTVNYDPAAATNRVAIGNGRLISTDVNAAGRELPGRLAHVPLAVAGADRQLPGREQHGLLLARRARLGRSGVDLLRGPGHGIAGRPAGHEQGRDGPAGGHHALPARFNGPFPFTTDGVIVGIPSASFEEEMQTKITFAGGSISTGVVPPREHAPVVGRQRLRGRVQPDLLQGGLRGPVGGPAPRPAPRRTPPAASARRPATRRSTPASSTASTRPTTATSTTLWTVAPSNPTVEQPVRQHNTYTGPAASYIALRQILGKDNFNSASKEIQRTFGGGSITEPQEIAVFHKWLPNQSDRLLEQAGRVLQAVVGHGVHGLAAAGNKPQITGPGLAGPRLL